MKKVFNSSSSKELPMDEEPALTPEAQEDRCTSLAYNLAEKRLKDGSATSQEVCYFLKLGSSKAKQENEKLQEEIKLLKAKTENLEAFKISAEIAQNAILAMKKYSGNMEETNEDISGTYDYQ